MSQQQDALLVILIGSAFVIFIVVLFVADMVRSWLKRRKTARLSSELRAMHEAASSQSGLQVYDSTGIVRVRIGVDSSASIFGASAPAWPPLTSRASPPPKNCPNCGATTGGKLVCGYCRTEH